jgi:Uma2 family endonuclease
MIQRATREGTVLTAADLFDLFGPISLSRIGFEPLPGTATEEDVLNWHLSHKRLYELVDGVLVEKTMGLPESFLACVVIQFIRNWVAPRKLGAVTGADGMMRLAPGLIRIPDVSFIGWEHFPNRQIGTEPIPGLVPDLAVEVLSPSNTKREMERKLQDYFGVGVKLVWYIDPRQRTVEIYTALNQTTRLTADQSLDGGTVLPGYQLLLAELFAELDPH